MKISTGFIAANNVPIPICTPNIEMVCIGIWSSSTMVTATKLCVDPLSTRIKTYSLLICPCNFMVDPVEFPKMSWKLIFARSLTVASPSNSPSISLLSGVSSYVISMREIEDNLRMAKCKHFIASEDLLLIAFVAQNPKVELGEVK